MSEVRNLLNICEGIFQLNESIDGFVKAFENHQQVHNKYSDQGASDTEPLGNTEMEVRRWLKGDSFRELSAGEWELYSSASGAGRAAKSLNTSLKRVYNAFSKLGITDRPALIKFLNSNFYYIDIEG